jgi:hypothetical protein
MISKVGSPPLDILVRTSGVKRLSDFMLWQARSLLFIYHAWLIKNLQCCEDTQLHLASAYWPEFGLWDFVPIILDYQRKVWARSSLASPRSLSIRRWWFDYEIRWRWSHQTPSVLLVKLTSARGDLHYIRPRGPALHPFEWHQHLRLRPRKLICLWKRKVRSDSNLTDWLELPTAGNGGSLYQRITNG